MIHVTFSLLVLTTRPRDRDAPGGREITRTSHGPRTASPRRIDTKPSIKHVPNCPAHEIRSTAFHARPGLARNICCEKVGSLYRSLLLLYLFTRCSSSQHLLGWVEGSISLLSSGAAVWLRTAPRDPFHGRSMLRTPPSADSPTLRVIDRAELSRHNTVESTWIVIDGLVYDVTGFKHPGGWNRIFELAGTDATRAFKLVKHSADAFKYMPNMCIGRLASGEGEAESSSYGNASEVPGGQSAKSTPSRPLTEGYHHRDAKPGDSMWNTRCRGFLPSRDPLKHVGEPYTILQELVEQMPAALADGCFRRLVEQHTERFAPIAAHLETEPHEEVRASALTLTLTPPSPSRPSPLTSHPSPSPSPSRPPPLTSHLSPFTRTLTLTRRSSSEYMPCTATSARVTYTATHQQRVIAPVRGACPTSSRRAGWRSRSDWGATRRLTMPTASSTIGSASTRSEASHRRTFDCSTASPACSTKNGSSRRM